MRINKFVALATGQSRRTVDEIINQGRIKVNTLVAQPGQDISSSDIVTLDGESLTPQNIQTIVLNKPAGYVCSRDGQGSSTIYSLLPSDLHNLKPVGRLDKDSSGLLLLTNDGDLAHKLTHPSFNKQKIYKISLDRVLTTIDKDKIEKGIELGDGISRLRLNGQDKNWQVTMNEGRNRQIRRTFDILGYSVNYLHRIQFGDFKIGNIATGKYITV